MVPDDVLLNIFDFYVVNLRENRRIEGWQMLAHVCGRWRRVVFQSPLRLNLRLLCTPKTPATDILDIWPPLPFIIRGILDDKPPGVDNVIAALEHNDRVLQIELTYLTSSEFRYVTDSVMLKPFPALTDLSLDRSQYFPIRSWAEPLQVCDHLSFRYRNYFSLVTL